MDRRGERFCYEGLPGRVVFGAGRLADLPAELDRLDAHRVVLIDGLMDPERVRAVEGAIAAVHATTITDVRPHVPVEIAKSARRLVRDHGADCLVALGGGSAIGLAKAVALTDGLPVVAVPTTYAGSECTPIWGITEQQRKTTGRDLRVLPRTVIYDPELTLSLPADMSAASGMNALAHCVEALWTTMANPVTDALATEGVATLAAGLRAVVRDPGDLGARAATLRGAWLGGTALAVAGTGLHHKICHVLGGTFEMPHAEVHAAVLPYVTEFVTPAVPGAVARVAQALGEENAVEGLRRLAADLGAASTLGELGLTEERAGIAADLVAAGAPAHPRRPTTGEAHEILDRARLGAAPAAHR